MRLQSPGIALVLSLLLYTTLRAWAFSVSNSNWKNHKDLNPTLSFASWKVPNKDVQSVLDHVSFSNNATKRIRLVRPYNETHQLVLHTNNDTMDEFPCLQNGPSIQVQLDPSYFSVSHILNIILPSQALPPPTTYEQVGHVAHLNLQPQHEPYAEIIGDVLVYCIPGIDTVVQKVGEVQGPHRTYEMQILAGRHDLHVTVVEHGISLSFHLNQVYWNSRLAGERQYLLQHVIQPNQTVVDVFCGAGMLCLQSAAQRHCTVYANDHNPYAIQALQEAAIQHGLTTTLHTNCGDAYEYLVDVGLKGTTTLPHHVFMNYPLEAPSFLNALRWWKVPKKKTAVIPTIHVYTFARATDTQSADNVAIDVVAHNLVPEANEPTPNRKPYLNSLQCNVQVRQVRNVAPGKWIMCVSFKATPLLLRHVQGDFV